MPAIHVLSKEVAELIAAGEVIERPASIIKELVENSIDAGATAITVEIQNGGVRFIRITDNGCGIAHDDASKAFLRHATSKVRSADDLDHIATLGFRGEALASVAAVAKVELLTKTPEAELGTLVKISGSEVQSVSEAGCPSGTTLIIRDVFFNVPARLKFLKKDVSEANAVAAIVDKIALSHPEIALRFIRDNKTIFHTPGDGKLLSAIYTIFGREFAATLLPVSYQLNGISVEGFICKPMTARPNRLMQHFFLNGRYTKTKTCAAAVEEGYKGALMVGKCPACVLQIGMPCDQVDVNVHPAKIEVRFVNERVVFDGVYFAVKSALTKENALSASADSGQKPIGNLLAPPMSAEEGEQTELLSPPEEKVLPPTPAPEKSTAPPVSPPKEVPAPPIHPSYPTAPQPPTVRRERTVNLDVEPDAADFFTPMPLSGGKAEYAVTPKQISGLLLVDPESTPKESVPPPPKAPAPKEPEIEFFGELFETYLLAKINDNFLLIDKHAAHERILYNQLVEDHETLPKQQLLTSIPITLARQEYQIVLEQKALFDKMGFTVEDFGDRMVLLSAVPAVMNNESPGEVFLDLVNGVCGLSRPSLPAMTEEILHRIACRSAIKANDKNHKEELLALIKRVYLDETVRYCPHGRPVFIKYGKKELEKLFGRS